jgi:uncharacterized protein
MPHYLLFYDKTPESITRQAEHSGAHREHLAAAVERGELLLGGNLDEISAALLFLADSRTEVEQFAQADPYVVHGIVTNWRVQLWETVVGNTSYLPTR